MRKILSFLFIPSLIFGMHKKGDLIPSKNVFASHDIGKVQLYHHPHHGFGVQRKDVFIPIQSAYMTKELRNVSKANLNKFIAAGSKFHIAKQSNDSYKIDVRHKLNGGGAIGAGIGSTLGFGLIMGGWHFLVSAILLPVPAGSGKDAARYALESAGLPFVLPIAKAAAVGGGVIGGVLTGPI